MTPHQRFHHNAVIKSLAVRKDKSTGELYSRITDIQRIFPGASLFTVDGVFLNFLEDENEQEYEPKRIAHYPDTIIDIVNDSLSLASSSPFAETSTYNTQTAIGESSHLTQLLSSDSMDLSVLRLSLLPTPVSPLPSSSLSSTSLVAYQTVSVAHPMAMLSSIASEITQLQSQLAEPTDQQPAHHQQLLERLLHLVGQQNEMLKKATSKEREEEMLRVQQETIDQLIVKQQRVDAILDQNHELRKYPIPRLFVILPEPTSQLDTTSLLSKKYRLHFLCECREHWKSDSGQRVSSSQTTLTGAVPVRDIPVKNWVHLTSHAGYELSRPNEFYDCYGTFVLGTLRILKNCLEVAGLAQGGMRQFIDGVDAISKDTIEAVDISIGFLRTKLNDNSKLAEDYGQDGGFAGEQEDDAMLQGLAALEGADLLRLHTFLHNNDQDNALGDLHRTTTEQGHVKWVCFEHYKESYRRTALDSFVASVEKAGGIHDAHFRKVVITLMSASSALDFFGGLAKQASSVEELDVSLHWKFSSSDLDMLVDLVGQSNVRTLNLDLKEIDPGVGAMETLFGKGRCHSLLALLSNIKLRGLCFSNLILMGMKTSNLPSSQSPSLLQSFHFLECFHLGDTPRLVNIIQHCPGLVDLRLGSHTVISDVHLPLYRAICSLKKLQVLHLYTLCDKISDYQASTLHVPEAMRDVVFEGDMCKSFFRNAIRGSMATLEVLSLDVNHRINSVDVDANLFFLPKSFNWDPYMANISFQPSDNVFFSKLSYLDVSSLSNASIEFLVSVLPRLSLVHFGAGSHTNELLPHYGMRRPSIFQQSRDTLKTVSLIFYGSNAIQ
ncbi:hypothetical protein BGX23_008588 [Mortierella sp. AD031]|nr:hypothetical protein BGX23_008588 [Mortierella sp. AD031]